MDSTEGVLLDSLNLFGITVNGTEVSVIEQSGRRWYRLPDLFHALGLQGVGNGGLSSKPGNLFPDSEEFQKYKGIWYGTTEGLSMYAEHLHKSQFELTYSLDKETAQARFLVITQWLSYLDDGGDAPGTAEGPMEYESNADAVPLPTETNNEQIPTNDEKPEPMDMPTAKMGAIDLALFDRLYDNLLARISYLASCLPISNHASAGEKMFAVLAVGLLYPNEPIMRPQNDSDGIWGQEQFLCMSEAIRRSMLFGQ